LQPQLLFFFLTVKITVLFLQSLPHQSAGPTCIVHYHQEYPNICLFSLVVTVKKQAVVVARTLPSKIR